MSPKILKIIPSGYISTLNSPHSFEEKCKANVRRIKGYSLLLIVIHEKHTVIRRNVQVWINLQPSCRFSPSFRQRKIVSARIPCGLAEPISKYYKRS